uniref:Uncharacterized protein n=1 Tax=Romanomermis culicivorax TaxID=13658 RepID=A0A915JI19_ROMCU
MATRDGTNPGFEFGWIRLNFPCSGYEYSVNRTGNRQIQARKDPMLDNRINFHLLPRNDETRFV